MDLDNGFPAKLSIKGNNIRLVPISMEYAPSIYSELTAKIVKWLDITKPPDSIDDAMGFIEASKAQRIKGTDLVLVILIENEFVGITGLHNTNTSTPRIGLWLKESAHRKGYGKKTVKLLINWARSSLKFTSISYSTYEKNVASLKIIESSEGEFIGYDKLNSNQRNYLIYP